MKKFFMLALALLISVAFVTSVFAQAKPEAKPADKPAAVAAEKAPAAEKAIQKAEKPATEKKATQRKQRRRKRRSLKGRRTAAEKPTATPRSSSSCTRKEVIKQSKGGFSPFFIPHAFVCSNSYMVFRKIWPGTV